VAEALHPYLNVVGAVAHRPLKFGPHADERYRFQALNFPAGVALKVGVGRVVLTGQFVMAAPALKIQPPEQAPAGEVIQDAVNRYLVHPAAGADHLQDL
jgi:hypothetical protein